MEDHGRGHTVRDPGKFSERRFDGMFELLFHS